MCVWTSSTSTVAEVRRNSSPESGSGGAAEQHRQGRSRRPRPAGRHTLGPRAFALLAGAGLTLSACIGAGDPESTGSVPDPATTSESTEPDSALAATCGDFWGDPDYRAPQSRVVLDRAGTAPQAGPSDPFFYAMTGDDIDATFADAPAELTQAADELSEWFRTQPEAGADADLGAFRSAWQRLAGTCAEVSEAAAWNADPSPDGTKPATLVCAETFDTPGTLTHFANANVLTSNMFKLVGRAPQQVPGDRMDQVQATADLLSSQIETVGDSEVAAALESVRAPFAEALDGDTWSDGLQEPLTELATACDTAGYAAPDPGEMDTESEDDDGGLV